MGEGGGCTHFMHSRIGMSIDLASIQCRDGALSGRHRVHQARSAVR